MIPRTDPCLQSESAISWQEQLKTAITEPAELLKRLDLDPSLHAAAELAGRQFPLRVPMAFVDRMESGNIHDPLLMQVLPIKEELIATTGFSTDPLQEQGGQQAGLIQKYQGRVLLLVNGHCAVNCRYCFRRHFPYEENRLNRKQWLEVFKEINKDSSIKEVILSGGDPLASSDSQLQWLTEQIAKIPHIKRLRIHSRLPVVIPDRITKDCLAWLQQEHLQTIFVLHINHPNEINRELKLAINKLKAAGITLLNQSVLLKGVNDSAPVLKDLSEDLFASGVLPYYLYLLDPVAGAAHFDIHEDQAVAIHHELLSSMSGYLVPKLVREIAGEASKIPVYK